MADSQLIIHGTLDDLVPEGRVRAYAAGLQHFGAVAEYVEYPHEAHPVGAGIFTEDQDPHDLPGQITAFFQKHLMDR